MQYEVQDFQREVIDQSCEVPILVDFWAEWCAPCRMLSPVLERLADNAQGAWTLAKVNTEQHVDVARQYGISSIPNVKLFIDGKVVNEFVGALPENMIKQWLKKALPNKFHKQIEQARLHIDQHQIPEAQRILEDILTTDQVNIEAKVLLARLLIFSNPQQAMILVENVEEPKFSELVEAIKTITRLLELSNSENQLSAGDVKDLYIKAITELTLQNFDSALTKFIDVIRTNRYYDEDGARKACIAIFKLLGEEHEITQKHRRDFGSSLYI